MALDLWFRDDVRRILQAAHEAMASTQRAMIGDSANTHNAAAYREGFEAALKAVSTAFGLNEQTAGYEVPAERWVEA